jgi:hypothetical protein
MADTTTPPATQNTRDVSTPDPSKVIDIGSQYENNPKFSEMAHYDGRQVRSWSISLANQGTVSMAVSGGEHGAGFSEYLFQNGHMEQAAGGAGAPDGDRPGINTVIGSKNQPNLIIGNVNGGSTMTGGDAAPGQIINGMAANEDQYRVYGTGNTIHEGKAYGDITVNNGSQTTVTGFDAKKTTIEMGDNLAPITDGSILNGDAPTPAPSNEPKKAAAFQVGNDTVLEVGNSFLTLKGVNEKDALNATVNDLDGNKLTITDGGSKTADQMRDIMAKARAAAAPVQGAVGGGDTVDTHGAPTTGISQSQGGQILSK